MVIGILIMNDFEYYLVMYKHYTEHFNGAMRYNYWTATLGLWETAQIKTEIYHNGL